jgi:hypothetical protein
VGAVRTSRGRSRKSAGAPRGAEPQFYEEVAAPLLYLRLDMMSPSKESLALPYLPPFILHLSHIYYFGWMGLFSVFEWSYYRSKSVGGLMAFCMTLAWTLLPL